MKLKSPTKMALYTDPKLLFQKSSEIRDFSRFLKNAYERRFPKKTEKKNRSTQTEDSGFINNSDVLIN